MSGQKRPTDHLEPAAKKRGSERQLTKDIAEDEEDEDVIVGEFQRADEDTLKQRKIVRARRTVAPTAATSNPFANVQLAPAAAAPAASAANPFASVSLVPAMAPAVETTKAEQEETAAEGTTAAEPPRSSSSERAADEQGAEKPAEGQAGKDGNKPIAGGFGVLAGGLGSGFSFGGGGGFGATGGFGSLASSAAAPAFSFAANGTPAFGAASATAGASIFGTAAPTSAAMFGAAAPAARADLPAQAVVPTGEEMERTVFSADGILFEWDAEKRWRERGRGEVRVNVAAAAGQARVVMRQKGNLRLLLNGNLWPQMQVARLEGGAGVSFAVVNHLEPAGEEEGSGGPNLAPFALRIKAQDALERFVAAVEQHKEGGGQ